MEDGKVQSACLIIAYSNNKRGCPEIGERSKIVPTYMDVYDYMPYVVGNDPCVVPRMYSWTAVSVF